MMPPSSFCPWKALGLALLALLVSASHSSESMIWGVSTYDEHSYNKPPQCQAIPDDLRLCHGVGYTQMLLPNLLDHSTMGEVRQQAGSWVPLVHKKCHPNTQVFLCSLFAPVCLEAPVYPCRGLCESVRDGCSPVMQVYGFPWPDMLACHKFPDNDVCIQTPNSTVTSKPNGHSRVCPPCENEIKTELILDNMCASEFAFKTKIKEVQRENADRKVTLQKKKRALKMGNLKKKDLKKLTLYLKNGANCPCTQLDSLNLSYLIMGRKMDQQYIITGIHKWDKKGMKKLRNHKCPTYENAFK